ncbi:hypothetical protein [Bradyrhizobium sp. 151]|uniref:hypothetical protein n=1 Tax=Bradyrhizobium sp. 151 TaxID=2782626 RepID=UPI001FF7836B|nr:hypothetical protein [Bradyrhizobium sp. 151]MCK1656935.1 hypothetical protein [Bradyrhizobium sp. 151]
MYIPKAIPQRDMEALFEAYGLTSSQGTQMEAFLMKLIHEFGNEIIRLRRRRTRADDRKKLTHAIARLSEAQRYLKTCGPIGRTIVRNNISHLGEMFSFSWARKAFPAPEFPKQPYASVNPRSRRSPREERVHIEEHTLQYRRQLARSQNIALVSAALGHIHNSLEEALRQGKSRGGRNKAELRSYFVMNLADFWQQIGRDPCATGSFEFPQFSEHVLRYVGWPTSGLRPTIRKALAGLSERS